MHLYYHIDAFTSKFFAGNPAGVCFLEQWLEAEVMQSVAAENSVPETAFLVPADGAYELRWFSPEMEIDLCGHATLASAHAIFEHVDPQASRVVFNTASGELSAIRKEDLVILDFPSRPAQPCAPPEGLAAMLGAEPAQTLCGERDLMAVFADEEAIRGLEPDFEALAGLDAFAVIATAPGAASDFVSRFFAPRAGVPEDPVTGSAHCTLIPFWSERLGKKDLYALQLSRRGGELFCSDLAGGRVAIGGRAVTYMTGTITI